MEEQEPTAVFLRDLDEFQNGKERIQIFTDKLDSPAASEQGLKATTSTEKCDRNIFWVVLVVNFLLMMPWGWHSPGIIKTCLAIATLTLPVHFARLFCKRLSNKTYQEETDIDDNLREEEELDRINCDKLKKDKVAQESEQQENPKESNGRSYRNDVKLKWLKIQYDRRTRAKKVAEEELFSLKKEYEENAREWIRKLKKVRDKHENDKKQWDKERNNLIAQLGDATESSKMYNDLSRVYEEYQRKWEEEKNDLVAKLDAAVASSELYRGFLHDFDHYYHI